MSPPMVSCKLCVSSHNIFKTNKKINISFNKKTDTK